MFEWGPSVYLSPCPAQVYLRAHSSLQGDMEQWASALSAVGERSQPTLRFLLGFLTGDNRITQTVSASLFGCEEDCLCLADDNDYLVINYLTATEIVSSLHIISCTSFDSMHCPLHVPYWQGNGMLRVGCVSRQAIGRTVGGAKFCLVAEQHLTQPHCARAQTETLHT